MSMGILHSHLQFAIRIPHQYFSVMKVLIWSCVMNVQGRVTT